MKSRLLPHRSVRFSIVASSLTASIGLLGGIALQSVKSELIFITPLLIALPALNAMAGDYATLVSAHLGDPERSRQNTRKLIYTLFICVPVSVLLVFLASLWLARTESFAMNSAFAIRYGLFISGAFATVIALTAIMSFALNKALSQHRYNSDDMLIPVANVFASVLMFVLVSFAAITLL